MLKPIIEKIEDAPSAFQSAYVEDNGKFVIDLTKYDQIATVGLKDKIKKLSESESQASAKLKRFDRFSDLEDGDLDELLSLREQKAQGKLNADELTAKHQEQLRIEREKLTNAHKAELAKRDEAVADVTGKFTNRVKKAELLKLALANGVIPEMAEDLIELPSVFSRFRVADVERGTLELLDDDGTPSVHAPNDFFKTVLREAKPRYYAASDKGGSGAPTGGTGGGGKRTMRRADWEKLSPAESTKFFAEGGKLVD